MPPSKAKKKASPNKSPLPITPSALASTSSNKSVSDEHAPASFTLPTSPSTPTPQQALEGVLQKSSSSSAESNKGQSSAASTVSFSSSRQIPPALEISTPSKSGKGKGLTAIDVSREADDEQEDDNFPSSSKSARKLTVPPFSPSPFSRKLKFAMDHPVKEINQLVRSLCQGTPREQRQALELNFLPDAEFMHPFCCVPSFQGYKVPWFGELNSRMLILVIFKWYKMLSPKIELEIESHVFDQKAMLLYLTISQTFALWFIPGYKAPVRLVTVLHLKQCQIGEDGEPVRVTNGTGSSLGDNGGNGSGHGRTKYMISKQEDLYQVNEFLKFIIPGIGAPVYMAWQFFSTILCLAGVMVFTPFMAVRDHLVALGQRQKTS